MFWVLLIFALFGLTLTGIVVAGAIRGLIRYLRHRTVTWVP